LPAGLPSELGAPLGPPAGTSIRTGPALGAAPRTGGQQGRRVPPIDQAPALGRDRSVGRGLREHDPGDDLGRERPER
jgi:hypothetical protein